MAGSRTTKALLSGVMDQIYPKSHGRIRLGSTVDLQRGRLHEVLGDAADCFAVMVAAQTDGPIVWIGLARDITSLAPTALQHFIDPARVLLTEISSRQEALWASEQALRTKGAAIVVCELGDGPNLKASRRLQIAAEKSGALGLLILSKRAQTSACVTRWECSALDDAAASWLWRMTKNKSDKLGAWRVKPGGKDDAPGTLHMAAATPL